jgi:menaquinol-cytochrome c reductase iron-sulfur subunit
MATIYMGKPASSPVDPLETTRRGFLKLASGILTALVGLTLAIPLIGTLVGSAWQRRKSHWSKVTSIDALPTEQPVSLTFADKIEDAYINETVLHSVWAVKHSKAKVVVYSPICPHLGCKYSWDTQTDHFECPCHGSVFALDGKVLAGPAPRPLDTLPIKIQNGELAVAWERFKLGIREKIPV